MLRFGSSINNLTVTSLQVGYPVATATSPIINPDNLTIVGFYCETRDIPPPAILLSQSVRELSGRRIIVDDENELAPADELIRDKEAIRLNYELIDKKVVTERKHRLGKIEDYVIDDETFIIQKIHVARSALSSLKGGKLIIDRSQVVETNDKYVVVKDGAVKAEASPRFVATPS